MGKDRICVVGSLNVDLVAYVHPKAAAAGYTTGGRFESNAGGKSLNAALSLASAGIGVDIVGRVGDDLFGQQLLQKLDQSGLSRAFVAIDPIAHTGIGHVRVSASGEYDTVVIPGANGRLSSADVDRYLATAESPTWTILNLEFPLATVVHAASAFAAKGSNVVLNLSPLDGTETEFPAADVTVLNAREACIVLKRPEGMLGDIDRALDELRRVIGGAIVVTLGEDGAAAIDDAGICRVEGHPVDVVNAVGAGDSFLAVLVLALSSGESLPDVLAAANLGGMLACQRAESNLAPSDIESIERQLGIRLRPSPEMSSPTGGTA